MANNSSKKNNQIAIFFAFVLTVSIGLILGSVITLFAISKDNNTTSSIEVPEISDEEILDEDYVNSILNLLDSQYIDELDSFESEQLTYGAIKGIIESLDDRYTSFYTPEEAQAYTESRSPDFEGIGVTLGFDGDFTYVETVIKSFPAEAAGVQNGDIILDVDGEDFRGKLPREVANVVRGEKGTDVTLTVARISESSTETLDITITRDKIDIDNILWERNDDGVVQIDIIQFSDATLNTFIDSWNKVVEEIEESGEVNKVIVDLRGNPGGYVEGVKYVLEEFLEDGEILMGERARDKDDVFFYDDRKGAFEGSELVVLVNEGSASASEIFAAAIQDNDRGEVVGTETVGKGVEQRLIDLSDGSIILLVFQKWITPNGSEISEESPIKPDFEVETTTEDFKAGIDPQELKAFELLR